MNEASFIATSLTYLAIMVLVPVVIAAGPVWLLGKLGKPGLGLTYVVSLTLLVIVDYFYNWDGLTYPTPFLAFALVPALSFPMLMVATLYAAYNMNFPPEPFDVDPR